MAAPAFPAIITDRWASRNLTGEAQHVCIIRVRPGYMKHNYLDTRRIDNGSPIYPPLIWKGINHNCWKGEWTPLGDWITLPQIESSDFTTSFQSIGEVGGTGGSGSGSTSSVLTTVMVTTGFEEIESEFGIYHTMTRGYFSPIKGAPLLLARPALWGSNEWTNALNGGYQIEMWEGYGPPGDATATPLATPVDQVINGKEIPSCRPTDSCITRTWTGIIETIEPVSEPDQITITSRDFGVMFTDQRCMGWNKAKEIRAPTRFSDRKQTQGEDEIAGPYTVNSGLAATGLWVSSDFTESTDVAWIEMSLPAGYYEDFFWAPRYAGQQMFVSLYMGPAGGTRRTGDEFAEGWVDLGLGNTPDDTPYIREWGNVIRWARRWSFTPNQVDGYNVPDGSKIRLSFTNLSNDPGLPTKFYYAGGQGFNAYKFADDPSKPPGLLVNATHWVLVEDCADVITMLCIWCGFQEWSIENFGWSLAHTLVFGEDSFFMDIINDVLAQGNFMFWMAPPTDDDRSIGVPVFQHQTAMDPPPRGMIEVRDTELLEDADFTWDNSDLPLVMRTRGNLDAKGQTLDQDTQKRFMGTYYPPWAGGEYSVLGEPNSIVTRPNRVAGIRRHFTQTLGASSTIGLDSDEECLFGCILAAIQYALQMISGTFQVAGLPAFDLNDQVSVIDEGTGVNSRCWVASIQSNHTLGPNGSWHMTIGGSLIDVEDTILIARDYVWAWWRQHGKKRQYSEQSGVGYTPAQLDEPEGVGLS